MKKVGTVNKKDTIPGQELSGSQHHLQLPYFNENKNPRETQAITLLPFNLPGKIYRSPMPFGSHDPDRGVLQEYLDNDISVVVPLVSVEECQEKAGMDLHRLYRDKGFDVVSLPVDDFSVPGIEALARIVDAVIKLSGSGKNIVVHCSAGQGRTGTFMACLARRLFGFSGDQAIEWTRRYIPGAVETELQEQLVRRYVAE